MNEEEEAERKRGIRFFLVFVAAFAASTAVRALSGNWLLGLAAAAIVLLSGYRWTRAPRA